MGKFICAKMSLAAARNALRLTLAQTVRSLTVQSKLAFVRCGREPREQQRGWAKESLVHPYSYLYRTGKQVNQVTRWVSASQLTYAEQRRLLEAPETQIRSVLSTGAAVIKYHALEEGHIHWLGRELGYPAWDNELMSVLDAIAREEPVYTIRFKRKRDGGERKILVPDSDLKRLQRRVLRNILSEYSISPFAFGGSGGNIFDAIRPHLGSEQRVLFTADVVDAFGSVRFEDVFQALYGLPIDEAYDSESEKNGRLYWEVAYALTRVMTCGFRLPQGAPSSPRLFDIVFGRIDTRLERMAENVGGVYTRYADNLFFSLPGSEIGPALWRAIVRTIQESHHTHLGDTFLDYYRSFKLHKIRTVTPAGEALRLLGVNIVGTEIHPTRELKRKIRLSLHRFSWLLANTPYDVEELAKCWGLLSGQVSFASQTSMPEGLLAQYEALREVYEEMLYCGIAPPMYKLAP